MLFDYAMTTSIVDVRKQAFKLEVQAKELDEKNRSYVMSLFMYVQDMLGEIGQLLERAKKGQPGMLDESITKLKSLVDFTIKNEKTMQNPQIKSELVYFLRNFQRLKRELEKIRKAS
jgi:hypothetical protein